MKFWDLQVENIFHLQEIAGKLFALNTINFSMITVFILVRMVTVFPDAWSFLAMPTELFLGLGSRTMRPDTPMNQRKKLMKFSGEISALEPQNQNV